jgi:tryptophan 2,3-dioxygenase
MSTKYATTHYHSYLELQKVLDAQHPKSAETGKAAHDEMLFIIIHQAYELWFKQIVHELESIVVIMQQEYVDERNLHKVEHRLNRIIEIQQLLIQQIRVLETMSPLEFLEFRDYLFPASGFQSFQFRMIETLLGLRPEERLLYNSQPFYLSLEPTQQHILQEIMQKPSLFDAIENWLQRMPFTQMENFNFLQYYNDAVQKMFAKEKEQIEKSEYIGETEKNMRITILAKSKDYFDTVTNKELFEQAQQENGSRLSYQATLSALFIHLYSEEPLLSNPYKILMKLVDVDELFTTWRYRHAQMVMRMLGKKMGTGGSSGHDYLKDTAAKHQVFRDFHNISTLLVPSSYIPHLPADIAKQMSFHFNSNS